MKMTKLMERMKMKMSFACLSLMNDVSCSCASAWPSVAFPSFSTFSIGAHAASDHIREKKNQRWKERSNLNSKSLQLLFFVCSLCSEFLRTEFRHLSFVNLSGEKRLPLKWICAWHWRRQTIRSWNSSIFLLSVSENWRCCLLFADSFIEMLLVAGDLVGVTGSWAK